MRKYLVSFATKNFKDSQKLLNQSALKFGIDEVVNFTPEDIKITDFYKKNRAILDQKRGAGYWLWKPYIILQVLNKINDGDILAYSDSGIEIIDNLEPLFKILQNDKDILTFSNNGHLNKTWTKRDCFILMNCDSEKYWEAEQRLASFHLYKKSTLSADFLKDWLKYAEDERIITDKENTQGYENLDGFKDHRHDQSIFSILAVKNNIEMFRDPTQRGNYLKLPEFRKPNEFLNRASYSSSPYFNSPYGTLLNHHRKRKGKLKEKIRNRIMRVLNYFSPRQNL